ncbi:HEAT repeat domain-containing protein [Candidatus Poribacteria bacterium]|nr:HEAT repeat domain-containing protein [Candidatus Poribacteria bacterium]
MSKSTRGMNKHQKRSHRRREDRVRGDEVNYYLSLAYSVNPADRALAMENLCPCHVRKKIDAVWVALYKGMLDEDIQVRRAAWHTLDDGGNPNDPRLQPLLKKIIKNESDPKLRQKALDLIKTVQDVEDQKQELITKKADTFNGRCDWCGISNVSVRYDYETEFDENGAKRLMLICDNCMKNE